MTVTRADLTEAVYQEVGLSRNESAQLVESVLEEVASTLAQGEAVKVPSFGTFLLRDKAQRMGRNPKTGEDALIPRPCVGNTVPHERSLVRLLEGCVGRRIAVGQIDDDRG